MKWWKRKVTLKFEDREYILKAGDTFTIYPTLTVTSDQVKTFSVKATEGFTIEVKSIDG